MPFLSRFSEISLSCMPVPDSGLFEAKFIDSLESATDRRDGFLHEKSNERDISLEKGGNDGRQNEWRNGE